MHILLVEDDEHVAEPLVVWLEHHGHEVRHVTTATQALDADPADLVLLDLMLPDLDGFELCRRLRKRSEVPIIMATARSDEIDRVLGLHAGADDYLVKPFGLRELLARIEAVTRRARRAAPAGWAAGRAGAWEVPSGRLVVDARTRKALLDGEDIKLTRKEFDLLRFLYEDFGAVRTRDEIIENVWDEHWFGSTRTIDVHVAALRVKLGDPSWIETVRGVGFRLSEPGR